MTNRHYFIGAALISIVVLYSFSYKFNGNENTNKTDELIQSNSIMKSTHENNIKQINKNHNKTNSLTHKTPSAITDPNPNIKTLADRLDKVRRWSKIENHSLDDISKAVRNPKLWDLESTPNTDSLPLDEQERKDGRQFFEANALRVAVSLPGDVFHVSAPDVKMPYELTVEQISSEKEGVMTMRGKLKNELGTFTLSQGNGITSGHINASDNTYSFEIFGNTGWIHESGALFTEELPPVPVDDTHAHSESLGNKGEHIIVKNSR
ncbi:hypothetical protein [Agaribacterium sp. ZY112]|uniref:hypothetical protein n=1 Tax=Agaribacterium sp. ZY112 TaxID=3233574 RepID=UPI0035256971